MDLSNIFPQRQQDDKDFRSKIILPTEDMFEMAKRYIDEYPELINLDYVREEYLPYLADMLGVPYLETEDSDVQREILKRVVQEYKRKGSIQQVREVIKRAYDENFFLGDLTYYKGDIKEGIAHIEYLRDKMFRFDYSRWDNARYGDRQYVMMGVINILASDYNERTLTYLDKVLPGGIKYYITMSRDAGGTDGTDKIIFPMIADKVETEIWLDPEPVFFFGEPTEPFRWDHDKWDDKRWDGNRIEVGGIGDELELDGIGYTTVNPGDIGYPISLVSHVTVPDIERKLRGEDLITNLFGD